MYLIEEIIQKIENIKPEHAAKLKKNIAGIENHLFPESEFLFTKYKKYLEKQSKTFDFSIECYLHMCEDMLNERKKFIETSLYSNSSFEDVEKNVYNNPLVMNYHMHGLVLAQYLWFDQYQRALFFKQNIKKYAGSSHRYLEIGGGHGLYMIMALEQLHNSCTFDLVDISNSSMDLAQGIINSNKVNYFLKNIFDFNDEIEYDFFTMGEVLEHVEEPIKLLKKLSKLIGKNGKGYITTPINSPMIDHIYLFNNAEEIRKILRSGGLAILEEKIIISEHISVRQAEKFKVPIMFAAFVENQK